MKRPMFHTDKIAFDPHKCEACWQCVENCPKQVFGKVKFLWHKHARIDNPNACIGCKKCVRVCEHGAITAL
ncbi:MAG: ferredoxin family protein [Muribaculaceae bacterium]|nr:ferredoxin family protein [Muribaculaceae bacterium]